MLVGKFVERQKPTYLDAVNATCAKLIGDDYQLYGKTPPEKEAEKKAAEKEAAGKKKAKK